MFFIRVRKIEIISKLAFITTEVMKERQNMLYISIAAKP